MALYRTVLAISYFRLGTDLMITAADDNKSHMSVGMCCIALHNFVVCQIAAAGKPTFALEDTRIDHTTVPENQLQECRIGSPVADVDFERYEDQSSFLLV